VASRTTDSARSLLSAAAVRNASRRILALALDGSLEDWAIERTRLSPTVDFVAKVVRERYPTLQIPVHARWRHFVFAGRDLWRAIAESRSWESAAAAARAAFDLAITSVLLDAGAGSGWRYRDVGLDGLTAARSEGLALASLRWFEGGGLSDDPRDPLRADAVALRRVTAQAVDRAFQSTAANPLQGAHGRAALLNRLGNAVQERPDLFAIADVPRPGGLFDALVRRASDGKLPAATILELLLEGLGSIWANRPVLDGVPLGDCWRHPALGGQQSIEQFVPLHKLSQWLAYSLIEPLELAGLRVCGVGELTGLAEYRNGGLLVDMGVLVPRDPRAAYSRVHDVSDPFVVGWRSATVALLDEIAPLVAARLGFTAQEFPLARVLEGGTWAAGRLIAREKRADGGPPFQISSDGTVF
jgi:Protein of unknown function (DUF1688)